MLNTHVNLCNKMRDVIPPEPPKKLESMVLTSDHESLTVSSDAAKVMEQSFSYFRIFHPPTLTQSKQRNGSIKTVRNTDKKWCKQNPPRKSMHAYKLKLKMCGTSLQLARGVCEATGLTSTC